MLYILIFISTLICNDTFSIVALDLETNEVGSAGASCISGSIIISDIHPGVGAIHTQSYWTSGNQNYASDLMEAGYSPNPVLTLRWERCGALVSLAEGWAGWAGVA